MEIQVNETTDMPKLELLNSVLMKELKESKMEIEKLKHENEILKETSKDVIEKLKQENDTLIAELAKSNDEKEKLVLERENVKLTKNSPRNITISKKNNKKTNSPGAGSANTMDIMQYILNPSDKSDPLNNSGNSAGNNSSNYDHLQISGDVIKTEMDVGPMNDFIKKFWKNPNSQPFSKGTLDSENNDEILLLDEYLDQNNLIPVNNQDILPGNSNSGYDLETPAGNNSGNNSQKVLVRKIDCKYCDEVFSNVDDFVNHSTTYHNNSGMEKVAENISRYKDHDATSENSPTTTAENSNKRKISSSYEIEYDPKNYDSIIYQDDTQNISNVPKRPRFNKLEMAIAPFKNIIMEIYCKELKALLHTDKFERGGVGECIQYGDVWYTPNRFEQLAGSKARKYKMSIKGATNGASIGEYIAKGYLIEQGK